MARKRKQTSKSSGPVSEVIDLLQENRDTNIDPNTKSVANICHKKSHGANNWQIFKELHKKDMEIKKPQNTHLKHQINVSRPMPKPIHQVITDSKTKSLNKQINKPMCFQGKSNRHKFDAGKAIVDTASNNDSMTKQYPAKSNRPMLTKHIAMDCEMVGVEIGVEKNMLARVSLVNSNEECVYDKFVKPTEPVLDYRTRVSGVRAKDLENAEEFKVVQKEVADILKGRVLIGHALKNDLKVLFLSHPKRQMRDTAKFKKFNEGRIPALKKLAKKYLGVTIQEGEHSSVQDALAAMQLYRMFKKEWEASISVSFVVKPPKKRIKNSLLTDMDS